MFMFSPRLSKQVIAGVQLFKCRKSFFGRGKFFLAALKVCDQSYDIVLCVEGTPDTATLADKRFAGEGDLCGLAALGIIPIRAVIFCCKS